jgi:uroporphyrinogen decarboxylase
MTGMERVMAALQGIKSDRRAFTMTLSLYGAKLTGCPIAAYYSTPECYLAGQVAVAEQCKPDILFAPFALSLEAQAFGSSMVYIPQNPPIVRKPFLRNPKDIGKLKAPDIKNDAGLLYLQNSARLLAGQFKGTIPVCGVLTSPMDLPAIIMGVENWLEMLLFDKEKTSEMIALMSEYFTGMANSLFDNGVQFIAMAMVFNHPKYVFEKTIKETIVPALSEIFAKLKGPVVFHHGGNPLAQYLKLYRAIPNIAGFVLDHRDDFIEARNNIGEKMLLLGNLDGPALGLISTGQALEKTRAILNDRKDDRHFIFATSCADAAWDTPLETITGIYDLVQQY